MNENPSGNNIQKKIPIDVYIKSSDLEKAIVWLSIPPLIITILIFISSERDRSLASIVMALFMFVSTVVLVFGIGNIISTNRIKGDKKLAYIYICRFIFLIIGLVIAALVSNALSIKDIPTACSVGFCSFQDVTSNMMLAYIIFVNIAYLSSCVVADRIYLLFSNGNKI